MNEATVQKIQRLVMENYNKIAADFDTSRKKELWPEARLLAAEVVPGSRVLDIGCGNGRLLEAWSNKDVEYLGADNSPALVTLAQKNYPDAIFRVMDILDLSVLPDNYYDHIFCLAVILHLPSRGLRLRALKNLAVKLKPGGRAVISVWDLYGYRKFRPLMRRANWHKFIGRSDLDYGDLIFPWKNAQGQIVSDRYYHAFRSRELVKLLAAAGLKIVKLYKKDCNYWLVAIK